MPDVDATSVTTRFNHAINARSLDSLGSLMTDDHRFVDSENSVLDGKPACLDAWRGFFDQFPDYRNIFTALRPRGDVVVVLGYSTCSFAALDGPALWRATIRDGKVAEWRVFADTAANRAMLDVG